VQNVRLTRSGFASHSLFAKRSSAWPAAACSARNNHFGTRMIFSGCFARCSRAPRGDCTWLVRSPRENMASINHPPKVDRINQQPDYDYLQQKRHVCPTGFRAPPPVNSNAYGKVPRREPFPVLKHHDFRKCTATPNPVELPAPGLHFMTEQIVPARGRLTAAPFDSSVRWKREPPPGLNQTTALFPR
jgi:hypothetical protein